MEKIVVVFDQLEPKKHSLRFNSSEQEPAVSSIYVSRKAFVGEVPTKIKITIEEVE